VLLVVEAERVRVEVARRQKDLLTQAKTHLLGVVLNKRPQHIPAPLYRFL
jgi:Mrp family chromosome partitioning ATPase